MAEEGHHQRPAQRDHRHRQAPLGSGLAGGRGEAWERSAASALLAALSCALLIQIGTNLHNDVADFERGNDRADRTEQRGERDYQYGLSLNQSLVTSLDIEARWAVREGHARASGELPRGQDLVVTAPLRKVLPDNVTLFDTPSQAHGTVPLAR